MSIWPLASDLSLLIGASVVLGVLLLAILVPRGSRTRRLAGLGLGVVVGLAAGRVLSSEEQLAAGATALLIAGVGLLVGAGRRARPVPAAPPTPPPPEPRQEPRTDGRPPATDPGDSVALAAGIAHDFNNLLTGVLGNAHVALAELPQGSSTRRAVAEIEEAGRRAQELVAQLLAYSGTGRLDVRPVSVPDLLEQAARAARAHLPAGVSIDVAPPSAGPLLVEADASHLRQAMLDLFLNAAEAVASRPRPVAARTGTASLDRAALDRLLLGDRLDPARYVWFEVEDRGGGIPDAVRERVFEPFFSTKPGGSGLGLAALYGVVRDHLGAIELDTKAGHGTRFRVWLPAVAPEEPPPALPHPGDDRLGGHAGTILVAEDEDLVRRAITRMLSRLGFDVVTTVDGADAVRAFTEAPDEFRLVFLDVRMPRMDGFEALERIREIRPDIPAVLCTGYAGIGADDVPPGRVQFLRKPFSLDALVDAVDEALEQTAKGRR